MENNQQKIFKQILDNSTYGVYNKQILDNSTYGVYNKEIAEKITIEGNEIHRRLIKILENINMNQITEMFESLTDIEVKQAIKEIKEDGALGIITSGGMVKVMAENMSNINKLKVSDNLFSAEILLLKQGAFRFIGFVRKTPICCYKYKKTRFNNIVWIRD